MGAPGRRVRRDGPAASSGRGGARAYVDVGGRADVDRRGRPPTSNTEIVRRRRRPQRRARFNARPNATRPDESPSRARRRALALPCVHRASASELGARRRSPPTPRRSSVSFVVRRRSHAEVRRPSSSAADPTPEFGARRRIRPISHRSSSSIDAPANSRADARRAHGSAGASRPTRRPGGLVGARRRARRTSTSGGAPTSIAEVIRRRRSPKSTDDVGRRTEVVRRRRPSRRATFIARPRAARPDASPSRARRRALALPCVHRASASELGARRRSPPTPRRSSVSFVVRRRSHAEVRRPSSSVVVRRRPSSSAADPTPDVRRASSHPADFKSEFQFNRRAGKLPRRRSPRAWERRSVTSDATARRPRRGAVARGAFVDVGVATPTPIADVDRRRRPTTTSPTPCDVHRAPARGAPRRIAKPRTEARLGAPMRSPRVRIGVR
jgi:hypothetical protein